MQSVNVGRITGIKLRYGNTAILRLTPLISRRYAHVGVASHLSGSVLPLQATKEERPVSRLSTSLFYWRFKGLNGSPRITLKKISWMAIHSAKVF